MQNKYFFFETKSIFLFFFNADKDLTRLTQIILNPTYTKLVCKPLLPSPRLYFGATIQATITLEKKH